MSVSVQDVLAALPELFPGTQQIPLNRIRPNPENPGPPITEEEIAEMASNLEVAELENPIKVMPDQGNPLAPGVALHPDNPRLRGDGQPWKPEDFNWVILAGELRYRAFDRLKRGAIPAFIRTPTPQQIPEKLRLDNVIRDRGWWGDYQNIELEIKANPNLTQAQVAARLKVTLERVNWAIRLFPLLNPETRAIIIRIPNNYNKGIWGVSETALFRLTDLGPGTGLKRGPKTKAAAGGSGDAPIGPIQPAPAETQNLFRRALQVACDKAMTEAEVKRLVAWLKAGNTPETFQSNSARVGPVSPAKPGNGQGDSPSSGTPASALTATTAPLTTLDEVPVQPSPQGSTQDPSPLVPFELRGTQGVSPVSGSRETGQGEGDTAKAMGAQAVPPASSSPVPGTNQISQASKIGAWITADQFMKSAKLVFGRITDGVFSRFLRAFHFVNNWFQKRGIKSPVVATILTAFLALWLGSLIIGWGAHILGRVLLYAYFARPAVSSSNPPAVPAPRSSQSVGEPVSQPVSHSPQGEVGSDRAGVEFGEGDTAKANGSNGSNGPSNPKLLASVSSSSVHGMSVDGDLSSNGVSISPQLKGEVAGVEVVEKGLGFNAPFGGNSGSPTPNSKLLTPNSKFKEPPPGVDLESNLPDAVKRRSGDSKTQARRLAKLIFTFGYNLDYEYWLDQFDCIAEFYEKEFEAQYYSQERRDKFTDNKLYCGWEPIGEPRLMSWTRATDDILVMGNVTQLSDADYPGQVIWKKREALEITFYYDGGGNWAVTKIRELAVK